VFRFYENENDATSEAMQILLMPACVVIDDDDDDDAFELGSKLQEQYNNTRLWLFHRNASHGTQRNDPMHHGTHQHGH
jgi:hypothetical protein